MCSCYSLAEAHRIWELEETPESPHPALHPWEEETEGCPCILHTPPAERARGKLWGSNHRVYRLHNLNPNFPGHNSNSLWKDRKPHKNGQREPDPGGLDRVFLRVSQASSQGGHSRPALSGCLAYELKWPTAGLGDTGRGCSWETPSSCRPSLEPAGRLLGWQARPSVFWPAERKVPDLYLCLLSLLPTAGTSFELSNVEHLESAGKPLHQVSIWEMLSVSDGEENDLPHAQRFHYVHPFMF